MLLFLLTTWNCFLRDRPSQYQAVQPHGGTSVAITDHGQTVAILVSPADALELQELRALAAYRARQASGEDAGVSHDEAYRRVFGGTEA
ncbi:hypothetical protein [Streptomyces sp. NPDC000994]